MASGCTQKKNKSFLKKPPIEKGRWAAKGTKPLPEQATVKHILSIMVTHICRKVLFIAAEVKITLYSISLFFGSLVFDFLPFPKIYLSTKDNFVNLYFVKIGWAWTFIVVGSFIILTSLTYGCGHKEIVKRHLSRLFIGSVFWLFWSQWFFVYVEKSTGVCLGKAILKDRWTCNHSGFQWHSFDISGHAFLLVYINLFLAEEAKAILGWEGIKDLLRIEEHKRYEGSDLEAVTTLSALSSQDLTALKDNYETWTPYIRTLFCFMTLVSIMCDVMLACTVIYFHTMPQKVAGGAIAIATWYFTYRFWFKSETSPGLPGSGLFKYQHLSEKSREPINRRQSSVAPKQQEAKEAPTFMGMPIYTGSIKKDRRRDIDDREEDRMSSEDLTDSTSRYAPRGDFFSAEPRYRYRKRTN